MSMENHILGDHFMQHQLALHADCDLSIVLFNRLSAK